MHPYLTEEDQKKIADALGNRPLPITYNVHAAVLRAKSLCAEHALEGLEK